MSALVMETAEVFEPLLAPARYKGARGGRGSGKSHFFAELAVDDAIRFPGEAGEGLRIVCIREVQKTLAQSAKRLIETKLIQHKLGERQGFKVFKDCIKLPGDGLAIFQGMQDHTADSIKSLEGFHRAWGEESQSLSAGSMTLLRPTIRWEDEARGLASELWFSWNPRRKIDPVDVMFRGGNPPTGSACVRANWSDNPWFPKVLEQERLDCLNNEPDQYDHIWEGGYVTTVAGAYYAKSLTKARAEKRIGVVPMDPLLTVRLFCDIGGTGARADSFTIWAAQFAGHQIRCLKYYEAVGQPLAEHLAWMRANDFAPDRAQVWLPHDGAHHDKVFKVSYESAFRDAGYKVTVVPNQGKGAASARIEAGRRKFPAISFDETGCEAGLQALGWYHEKKDDQRDVGLGPEHDWSSHGADSFGLMCLCHETQIKDPRPQARAVPRRDHMRI